MTNGTPGPPHGSPGPPIAGGALQGRPVPNRDRLFRALQGRAWKVPRRPSRRMLVAHALKMAIVVPAQRAEAAGGAAVAASSGWASSSSSVWRPAATCVQRPRDSAAAGAQRWCRWMAGNVPGLCALPSVLEPAVPEPSMCRSSRQCPMQRAKTRARPQLSRPSAASRPAFAATGFWREYFTGTLPTTRWARRPWRRSGAARRSDTVS